MRKHLASLDGLRGVAALAVAAKHFQNFSRINLHAQQASVAVDLFFVLSGYVIARAYEARLAEGLSWRSYMCLRLARLYFDDTLTRATGGERMFRAVGLNDNKRYTYRLVAVWVENGREVTHETWITFWGGGVDTQHTLPFGTTEEVRREVRERIRFFGRGGGFVFNAVHNIQALVPVENVIAMYETARELRCEE